MASSLFYPFHAFFSGRIARWLLYHPSFKGRKGLVYALGFLACVALAHIVSEGMEQQPNYYSLLGVNIGAPVEEMKRAYKQRSLQLHPDKNPSPTAQEDFTRLREAYDVLLDATMRDRYNRFGPDYVKPTPSGDSPIIGAAVTFYVIGIVLSYFWTMGAEYSRARSWCMSALAMLAVLEFQMRAADTDFLTWLFPRTPVFEKLHYLHLLLPSLVNIFNVLSLATYVNLELMTHQSLLTVIHSNRAILDMLYLIDLKLEGKTPPPAFTAVPNPSAPMPADNKEKSDAASTDSSDADKQPGEKSAEKVKHRGKKAATAEATPNKDSDKNEKSEKSDKADSKSDAASSAAAKPGALTVDEAQMIRERVKQIRAVMSTNFLESDARLAAEVLQNKVNTEANRPKQASSKGGQQSGGFLRMMWPIIIWLFINYVLK